MELGDLLLEVKQLVGHGRFTPWVANNCAFSLRSAQDYMRAANLRGVIQDETRRPASLVALLEAFATPKATRKTADAVEQEAADARAQNREITYTVEDRPDVVVNAVGYVDDPDEQQAGDAAHNAALDAFADDDWDSNAPGPRGPPAGNPNASPPDPYDGTLGGALMKAELMIIASEATKIFETLKKNLKKLDQIMASNLNSAFAGYDDLIETYVRIAKIAQSSLNCFAVARPDRFEVLEGSVDKAAE
jgi:hypothetical protein